MFPKDPWGYEPSDHESFTNLDNEYCYKNLHPYYFDRSRNVVFVLFIKESDNFCNHLN